MRKSIWREEIAGGGCASSTLVGLQTRLLESNCWLPKFVMANQKLRKKKLLKILQANFSSLTCQNS